MILLITPSVRGKECASALQEATATGTDWAENLQQAAIRLRNQSFSAVVIDQFLLDTEPDDADHTLQHLGAAIPIYINFAISGMERVVREVRTALHRRQREETVARRSAEAELRSELRETVTAMMLSCELALGVPNLPGAAAEKIRSIDGLARDLSARLGVS